MEQYQIDFSFSAGDLFPDELRAQRALDYLHDPIGYVREIRRSVNNAERFREMFDQWDAKAVALAAFLEREAQRKK